MEREEGWSERRRRGLGEVERGGGVERGEVEERLREEQERWRERRKGGEMERRRRGGETQRRRRGLRMTSPPSEGELDSR